MASGTVLKLEFNSDNGSTTTLSYKYAKSNATASAVKALVNGILANSGMFAIIPISAKSARLVTTSETPINLGD